MTSGRFLYPISVLLVYVFFPSFFHKQWKRFRLAQKYLEQHESKVSKSHLYMEELRKRGRLLKRHFSNFKTYLIPWEGKIKRIESELSFISVKIMTGRSFRFGSIILFHIFTMDSLCQCDNDSDYFFLCCFTGVTCGFCGRSGSIESNQLTESYSSEWEDSCRWIGCCVALRRGFFLVDKGKSILGVFEIFTVILWLLRGWWVFRTEGTLCVTTGLFPHNDLYFWVFFLCHFEKVSFKLIGYLHKNSRMAANTRMSKISGSKTQQYIFNWRLFTGWDYSIGNSETAANTVMAVVIKLRVVFSFILFIKNA